MTDVVMMVVQIYIQFFQETQVCRLSRSQTLLIHQWYYSCKQSIKCNNHTREQPHVHTKLIENIFIKVYLYISPRLSHRWLYYWNTLYSPRLFLHVDTPPALTSVSVGWTAVEVFRCRNWCRIVRNCNTTELSMDKRRRWQQKYRKCRKFS